ncbi:MAG: D-sedoheptulose 7-phosphate isomerase [Bacteroidales bacterium]|nr:D-sedoheptulose 7-phosphate isomerase [Bacteroidales bacterium]
MKNTIQKTINESVSVKQLLLNDDVTLSKIETVAKKMIDSYKEGHKTMFAGNGGSAADSQHLAAELVNRFCFDRDGIPALALSTDSSVVTSISNDYGYDVLFSRQIKALGNKGDVFVGISTSGNSENIINAFRVCKEKEIFTVGLTGETGGKMAQECDVCLCVPSKVTARIQESHILIGHIICGLVENALFEKK